MPEVLSCFLPSSSIPRLWVWLFLSTIPGSSPVIYVFSHKFKTTLNRPKNFGVTGFRSHKIPVKSTSHCAPSGRGKLSKLVATSHCSGWPRSGHQQVVVGWTRTSSGKGVGLLTLHNPVLQVLTIQQQMFLLLHNDISHLGPTLAPDTKKWSHKCPMAANLLPNHKTPLRVQDHFLTFQLAETCDFFPLRKCHMECTLPSNWFYQTEKGWLPLVMKIKFLSPSLKKKTILPQSDFFLTFHLS